MKSYELEIGMAVCDTYKTIRMIFTDMNGRRKWVLFTDGTYRIVDQDYEWQEA